MLRKKFDDVMSRRTWRTDGQADGPTDGRADGHRATAKTAFTHRVAWWKPKVLKIPCRAARACRAAVARQLHDAVRRLRFAKPNHAGLTSSLFVFCRFVTAKYNGYLYRLNTLLSNLRIACVHRPIIFCNTLVWLLNVQSFRKRSTEYVNAGWGHFERLS